MRQNQGDLIIEKLHKRRELVKAKLIERYKGVKPFRTERATNDEVMANFNNLPFEEKQEIIQRMGGK